MKSKFILKNMNKLTILSVCFFGGLTPAAAQQLDSGKINYLGGVIQDICKIETQDGTLASSVDKTTLSSDSNKVNNLTIGPYSYLGNAQAGAITVASNMKSGALITFEEPTLTGPSAAKESLISVNNSVYDNTIVLNSNESGSVETSSVDVLFSNDSGFKNGDYKAHVTVTCSAAL